MFPRKETEVVVTRKKATVEMVHREFDDASERLLQDAQQILSKHSDSENFPALAKLGFRKVGHQEQWNEAKEITQRALHSRQAGYKLISEADVERICKKYGLLLGRAVDFIGDMPKKNQQDILDFSCAPEDQRYVLDGRFETTAISYEDYQHNKNTGNSRSESEFFVIAQPSEFDQIYAKVEGEYRLVSKDPIVLYSVMGGYRIVTAWGLEKSIL